MKKLLIPVDFTTYSDAAISYATQLAEDSKHELDIIHVFNTHSNQFANRQIHPELIDPEMELAKKNMTKLINRLAESHPNLKVYPLFRQGNLYEEISKQTHAVAYDAVVMGTKGSSGMEAIFLGSNTYDVIANTKTPVLAVPLNSLSFKKTKIGLLCNFKPAEIQALQQATPLFGTDFELLLIHVSGHHANAETIAAQFNDQIQAIKAQTGISQISTLVKAADAFDTNISSKSAAIDAIITSEEIDILLVTKSRKSIFRKIIDENVVKKMAYEIKIPKFFARAVPLR